MNMILETKTWSNKHWTTLTIHFHAIFTYTKVAWKLGFLKHYWCFSLQSNQLMSDTSMEAINHRTDFLFLWLATFNIPSVKELSSVHFGFAKASLCKPLCSGFFISQATVKCSAKTQTLETFIHDKKSWVKNLLRVRNQGSAAELYRGWVCHEGPAISW